MNLERALHKHVIECLAEIQRLIFSKMRRLVGALGLTEVITDIEYRFDF